MDCLAIVSGRDCPERGGLRSDSPDVEVCAGLLLDFIACLPLAAPRERKAHHRGAIRSGESAPVQRGDPAVAGSPHPSGT